MRITLTNFTGGEIAPTLSARCDLARYGNSLQCMENFVPNLHGAAERRPGLALAAQLDGPAVLLPFSFNAESHQNFVLVLEEKRLRVASPLRGLLPGVALQTPYSVSEAYEISSAQVGDVVYLAHRKHPLHKLVRKGGPPNYTWELAPVALNISLPAPGKPTAAFTGGGDGFILRYKVVAVNADGKESLPSEAGEVNGKHPSDWVVGNRATVSWNAVEGAAEYNVYREEAGYFGFVGVASTKDASGGVVSGLQVGGTLVPPVYFRGEIARKIVKERFKGEHSSSSQETVVSDTTGKLDVSANASQMGFHFNGLLFVLVTKTTTTELYLRNEKDEKTLDSTQTSVEKFWAVVPTETPAGTYAAYKTGNLGNDNAAPNGTFELYSVRPAYTGAATLTFIDNNYQADVADTPCEDWDPFKDGNNPGVVAFHQQRMVLAATPATPQAFYMSRAGDFENFRKSRPLKEDDPVEYLVASGSIDAITWAASFGDLLLGTSGSEYKATGGDSGPISPTSISITAQSYWGSANLPPIIIGNSILHVQRHGARVRDLFYSLEKDGYAGNDLSIMAPHLFDGHVLRQWAYQQTPGSTIWVVRGDGVLLALTYMKEHDIWGWSRHVTQGKFLSAATISGDDGDVLMVVVRREINGQPRYFLERMAPRWSEADGVEEAFYVDCGVTWRAEEAGAEGRSTLGPAGAAVAADSGGGASAELASGDMGCAAEAGKDCGVTWRGGEGEEKEMIDGFALLEGCTLAVLADGSPVDGCVVREGRIRLPFAARVVHAGLPFTSTLSPLPVELQGEGGSTLGRKRAYGKCALRLHASVGGKYGADRDTLYDFPFVPARWGEACELFSGDVEFIPGGGQDTRSTLWLVQDRPLPMQVAAVMAELNLGQE